jgi:peptidyl-prolyl cis-trans isomerase D
MLPLFRKKKEWLRWVMLVVIIAIGLTTVLLFVNTPQGLQNSLGTREVAVVAGQPITAAEFGRFYSRMLDMYRQMYNLDRQDPQVLKQLRIGDTALNQLIRQYATSYAAQQMGLEVAPEELVSEISRLFQDPQSKAFIGTEQYKQILRTNNMTTSEFEAAMTRDLLAEKFRDIVTDGVIATPAEVRQRFLDTNQQVKVKYVSFDPQKLIGDQISDEKLQQYYDEHKEEFRLDEQREVTLLTVIVKPTDVEVTEEQIQAELANVPNEEQVHARHILVRTSPTPSEEELAAAEKKAEDILKQLRQGADFAEMARKLSDDTGSAAKGGDLGFFGRGQMVPEFEKVAFSQQPNQISDLVKSPFGFHIIQTLAKSGQADTTRRPAAEFNARLKEAQSETKALASQIEQQLKGGATLEDVAKEHSLETVKSGFFTRADGLTAIGGGRALTDEIFGLTVGGFTAPQETAAGETIARLDEVRASSIPSLDEIKEQVTAQYKEQQGNTLARERAFDFFRAAEQTKSLDETAKTQGLSTVTSDFFNKGSNVDETLRFSPEIHDQAFSLDVGGISTPVLVAGKYVVFEVAAKSEVKEEDFENAKAGLADQLTNEKRMEFFNAYVQNVVDNLQSEQKIVINRALLDDLTG